MGNSQKSKHAQPVNVEKKISTASLFREVHRDDREKARQSHPRGRSEDVWAIPSAGEAACQHRLLVGLVFGNQVTFTPVASSSTPLYIPKGNARTGAPEMCARTLVSLRGTAEVRDDADPATQSMCAQTGIYSLQPK